MKELIIRNIGGRKVLILFVLTNAVYAFMLTITIPAVMRFSGGMDLLDMMPTGYSPGYIHSLFDTLGDKGRHAYLFSQIPVDMIYPLLFAITYCLVLAYILNQLAKLDSILFYLCLVPVFSGIMDYSENIGIITMLTSYPNIPKILAQATNLFSVLKSISTTIYFLILIVLSVMAGIKKLSTKTRP